MATSRKNAKTGGEPVGETLDIPHEIVQPGDNGPGLTPLIETVDDQIKHEIAKFNFPDAAIAQLKTNYGDLVISGPDDKKGYETVKKAWNDVRSKRTGLEKKGLELRNNFTVITKAIKGEEVRLIEMLKPLEDDLYTKWKKIDDDKEREKKEREEAEGRRLMSRIEQLQQIGMVFSDGFYQIGETITADVASLRSMPDETFEKLKTAATNKAAELKRLADEQAEKKRQEEAEQERQRQEIIKKQAELEEQERQMKAQREEMARQLRELRLGKLQSIGLELLNESPEVVAFGPIRLYLAPLIELTSDEFNKTVEATVVQVKKVKDEIAQREEAERLQKIEIERREKLIASVLETAGMRYNYNGRFFEFSNEALSVTISMAEWVEFPDDKIETMGKELEASIAKAKEAQKKIDDDREREKKAAERLNMTDKEQWETMTAQVEVDLLKIVPAQFKTAKFQSKAQTLLNQLTKILNDFK